MTNDLLSFSLRHGINYLSNILRENIFEKERFHIYDWECR